MFSFLSGILSWLPDPLPTVFYFLFCFAVVMTVVRLIIIIWNMIPFV